MTKIMFEKTVQEARLLSPLNDFKLVTQPIEIRKDPLTGRRCRINLERAKRPKQAAKTTDMENIVEASRAKCFFCAENLEKMTPMFPEDFPERRIKVGTACIFPNLFPFGGFHAVGVFSNDHHLDPNQFSPKLLEDCFEGCLRYFEQVHERYPEIKYWHINWNYMPPAAASIIHPHVQLTADPDPTSRLQEFIRSSRSYFDREGSNYWSDLVEAERNKKERFIGKTGPVAWVTSFAPEGNSEVVAVFTGISAMTSLKKRGLGDFCDGLSRILKGYHVLGVQSFNMTTFSGPCDEDLSEYYLLNAKLVSRPSPKQFYTSDDGFMEKLHHESVIETMPETLAEKLREHF
ncbi:MAG: hypothetical protein ACETWO_00680 [Candidatus Hadarchaeaceae archaeon]